MEQALELGKIAYSKGEVPIGAVVVLDGQIIGRGYNKIEETGDASMHAEVIALREASAYIKNWRLDDVVLYATVAPCVMCSGLILNSRVGQLVYGVDNEYFSGVDILKDKIKITSGIMAEESAAMMRSFFAERRKGIKN